MNKKVYISGKMRGISEDVSQKMFEEAEQFLIKHGFEPLNPWKFHHTSEKWEDRILIDLMLLKDCYGIWMLDNWRDSNGAQTEYYFARGVGLRFMGPNC